MARKQTRCSHAFVAGLVTCVLHPGPSASGQGWIAFENETAVRLAPEPGFPYNPPGDNPLTDVDEKDYGVGDFDNDGDSDMVVVRKQPRTTPGKRRAYLFLNEGGVLVNRTNQFAPQLLDLCNNRDVAVVDLDGDDWPDLVTAVTFPMAGDSPSVKMPRAYMNLGADEDGDWLGFLYTYADQRIPDFPTNPFFCSVAADDLDDDGDPDLLFVDYASDSSVLDPPGGPLKNRGLLNDGNGFFTDVTQTNIVNSGAAAFVGEGFGTRGKIADLDGDDDPDLVAVDTCSAHPRTIRMARNDGFGVFTATNDIVPLDGVYDFDTGDINLDGKIDLLEVDDGSDRVLINMGNSPTSGFPTFMSITMSGQTSSTTQGFGGNAYLRDLDGDELLDAVVCDEDVDLPQSGNRMALFHGIPTSPFLTAAGAVNADPFILGTFTCPEPLCTRDTFDVAILDIDGNDKLDLVVGTDTGTKVFLQPPIISPPAVIVSTIPTSGTVDHHQDQNAAGILQGIDEVTIVFSEAVRDAASDGPVLAASFSTSLTTNLVGLTPPTVAAVTPGAVGTYVVTLSGPIPPGAWTTIAANVEDLDGNPVVANTVDIGFLPGDVSGQRVTNTGDLLAWIVGLNSCAAAGNCTSRAVLTQLDINDSGSPNTTDLLRIVQLLNGVNTQNPWNGVSLPPQP